MGILDKIAGKGTPKAGENTVVVLTPLGKAKSEKFDLPGAKWRVLSVLNENGPCTLGELSDETGMGLDKIKDICKSLSSTGYISRSNAVD